MVLEDPFIHVSPSSMAQQRCACLIPDAEEFLSIHREDVINHLWIFKQALVNSSLLVAPFGGAAMDVMEPDDHFETSTVGESACGIVFMRVLGVKECPTLQVQVKATRWFLPCSST